MLESHALAVSAASAATDAGDEVAAGTRAVGSLRKLFAIVSQFVQCMWLIQHLTQPQSKHIFLGNLLQFTWLNVKINSYSID